MLIQQAYRKSVILFDPITRRTLAVCYEKTSNSHSLEDELGMHFCVTARDNVFWFKTKEEAMNLLREIEKATTL